jgi:hypothetical protein
MAQTISQILFTEATTGIEKARFEFLMRKWRRSLLNDSIAGASLSKQRQFVNDWLAEFEEIFRNESAKINILSGYGGFVSASTSLGASSAIDDFLDFYKSTIAALTSKDLVQANGLRNSIAIRVKREGVANIYKSFDEFSKEARALGLTQRERVDGFLNTLGKDYTTILTRSESGHVMKWKPDAYARMYSNTRDGQMRDELFQDQLVALGSDIVQVSNHGTTTPICKQYEGKIYSLTGKTPGYPVLPQRAPFHPNCKHVILSRPRMTTREARKINFVQNKELSKARKEWPKGANDTIKKQEAWNTKNRPTKAQV